MSSPLMELLSAYYSDEMFNYRYVLRNNMDNTTPEARESLRSKLAALVDSREMSVAEFDEETDMRFVDEDEMYRELNEAYRYLFVRDDETD